MQKTHTKKIRESVLNYSTGYSNYKNVFSDRNICHCCEFRIITSYAVKGGVRGGVLICRETEGGPSTERMEGRKEWMMK